MTVYNVGPRQAFTPLPTGEYTLTLKEVGEKIEEKDSQYSKKGDVKVEWTFEVAVPNDEPVVRKVRAAAPVGWNEKSTFVHIAEALGLVNRETARANGASVDFGSALGRKCLGTIVKKLKEGSTTDYTDNITAYAPFVAAAGEAATAKPAGSKLRDRLLALIAFAGTQTVVPEGMSRAGMATLMKEIGARLMHDDARGQLQAAIEIYQLSGGDAPIADLAEGATLKDGFLLLEDIAKATEAL